MTAPSILVADDDPHIRAVIAFAVERAGMSCTLVADGAEAVRRFGRGGFDSSCWTSAWDWTGSRPAGGSGRLRRRRSCSFRRGTRIDRVLRLEIGGDDYVTKPFSPREVVARIRYFATSPRFRYRRFTLASADVATRRCRAVMVLRGSRHDVKLMSCSTSTSAAASRSPSDPRKYGRPEGLQEGRRHRGARHGRDPVRGRRQVEAPPGTSSTPPVIGSSSILPW